MEPNRPRPLAPGGAISSRAIADDGHLVARVRGEFAEIPGLSLTVVQASKLFGLDPPRCERILQLLVARGALRQTGGRFRHVDGCR